MRRLTFFLLIIVFAVLSTAPAHSQDQPQIPMGTPIPVPTTEANTAERLQVLQITPADGSVDILPATGVTMVFNRPVVPLTVMEDRDLLPDPLTITPAAAGEGEWINTFVYRFTPTELLLPDTRYTLSVSNDLETHDGLRLTEPFTSSFTTVAPRVMVVRFAPNTEYRLRPGLNLQLNTLVDRARFQESVTLHEVLLPVDAELIQPERVFEYAPEEQPADLVLDDPIRGRLRWSDENWWLVTFMPYRHLKPGTTYALQINHEALMTNGSSLEGPSIWLFTTLPLPQVIGTSPEDGSKTTDLHGFSIDFNTYIDADSVLERLTIRPEPEYAVNAYRSGHSVRVVFSAQGSTDYTVDIAPGIRDINGHVYDQPITFSYTTEPLPPAFYLSIPNGPVGFYNAYRDETALFVQYRNIDQLGVQLYSLTPERLAALLNPPRSETQPETIYNYIPPHDSLLREWHIETPIVQDVMLPTMLSLGEQSACDGTLLTGLRIGDVAVIRTSESSVEALSYPVDGAPTMTLFDSFSVNIVGGPICVNEAIWWQIEVGGTRAWLPERVDGETRLEYVTTLQMTAIDVAPDDRLAPGIYVLRVIQNGPESEARVQHALLVMTANLTLKASRSELVVWATDVQSGRPIPRLPVTLYTDEGLIAAGVTDESGLLTLKYEKRLENLIDDRVIAVASTGTHFGVGSTDWADGIDPGRFDERADFFREAYTAAIYTDREAYRPGDTVYFRGIVRSRRDMTYTVPLEFDSVHLRLTDGVATFERDVPLTRFGTFSGEIKLSEDSYLSGYHVIEAMVTLDDVSTPLFQVRAMFTIAEFRLPEFTVDVQPAETNVSQQEPIHVAVGGEYYAGGAVSNATVAYRVISSPLAFQYQGRDRYSFDSGLLDGSPTITREITEGTGTTGSDGTFTFELSSDLGEIVRSHRFTIEATMHDETNQTVSGRSTVDVHAGQWYIGTRAERYVNRAGEEATLHMILVDWDSIGVAQHPLEVEVVERRWASVQERDPQTGRTAWRWEPEDIPVTTDSVITDDEGKASYHFIPPNGGTFRVTFRTRDTLGNEIASAGQVWVSGSEYVPWRMENHYRVPLVADRDSYEVGDIAEILITSPFQGESYALVTAERYGVMSTEVIQMQTNSTIYRLPIRPEFTPNVFVSVMIVSGVSATNPVTGFRMGLVRLPVSTRQKDLHMMVEPEMDRAQPGATVHYRVRVFDDEGNPVQAEVGVALTDAAALAITAWANRGYSPESNWLLDMYYQQQGLGVRTTTPLTINADQITQDIIDQIKGGGGGGGGMMTLFNVRDDFASTTYWNATLVTDKNGEASFSVTLPDNLTTWRLNAYALTDGSDGVTRFGYGTHDLLSTMPLIVRPVTPRFMVVGDQVALGAVIHNNTDQELSVQVRLQAPGVTLSGADTRMITIPAQSRARVDWLATVNDATEAELIFYAASTDGRYQDASRPTLGKGENRTLPIRHYVVTETVATSGMLRGEGTRTEQILVPTDLPATSAELVIELEPSLAATTADGLSYLQNYPYQCIEQTVSRFLPNIITYRALASLDLTDETLQANLQEAVEFSLVKLAAEQKSDGGWGWFLREQSDPLTTAYAVMGLAEAQRQGYEVSAMLVNATGYLANQLVTLQTTSEDWRLNRQAFLLYAMATADVPNVGHNANLFEYRQRLTLEARAFLALAMHRANPAATERTDALLADFYTLAISSATGTHWESYPDRWNWGTEVRTNAIILKTLVTLDPDSELIPNAVRWLMAQRQNRTWATTQETAWSVMALTDWMLISGDLQPNYDLTLDLNGDNQLSAVVTPESARMSDPYQVRLDLKTASAGAVNDLVIGRTDGPGSLYYTVYYNVEFPVPEIEPLEQGILIQRAFFRHDGEDRVEVDKAAVGDLITVRLVIVALHDLHYVNVESPIPAGTEAIDRQFITSQQIGTQPDWTRINRQDSPAWWWFSNIEYRDDQVILSASYLPAGTYEFTYLVRATLTGSYNVIPSTAYEFYFPEVNGRSGGQLFTVLPEADQHQD